MNQKIDEIRAREQAAIESLVSKLSYCMDGGYAAYDTIRSLCQDAMITINRLYSNNARLTAQVKQLETNNAKLKKDLSRCYDIMAEMAGYDLEREP